MGKSDDELQSVSAFWRRFVNQLLPKHVSRLKTWGAVGRLGLENTYLRLRDAKEVNAESKDQNDPLSPSPATICDDKSSDERSCER